MIRFVFTIFFKNLDDTLTWIASRVNNFVILHIMSGLIIKTYMDKEFVKRVTCGHVFR